MPDTGNRALLFPERGERLNLVQHGSGKADGSERDYDQFAPYYRAYAQTRAAYIDAVDAIVIRDMPQDAGSMLDVGSADGVRAARIARRRGIPRFVLSEPSPVMVESCRLQGAAEVWGVEAQHLPSTDERFDVVTCLWNVLAQVPSHAGRIDALRRMRGLLANHGSLFLDVQNRYNARWYGLGPTLRRMLRDAVFPSEHNGDARAYWTVGETRIATDTHFFSPAEVLRLVGAAGLRVKRRHFIDYGSGETRRFFFEGQILCELEHAP